MFVICIVRMIKFNISSYTGLRYVVVKGESLWMCVVDCSRGVDGGGNSERFEWLVPIRDGGFYTRTRPRLDNEHGGGRAYSQIKNRGRPWPAVPTTATGLSPLSAESVHTRWNSTLLIEGMRNGGYGRVYKSPILTQSKRQKWGARCTHFETEAKLATVQL